MKCFKVVLIAFLPLLIVILLETITSFVLLSFAGFSAQSTAFLTNVGRVLVVIYILYFFRKKQINIINSSNNYGFVIMLIFGSIAISFIEIAVVHSIATPNSQFLVIGNYGWLKIVSGLFIASWTEEVLFRGWLLNYLQQNNVTKLIALVFSSFLFGFWHFNVGVISTWPLIVLHFFTGLYLGFIFILTKNILYSILAHFFMNFTLYFFYILKLPASFLYPILIVSTIYFLYFVFKLILYGYGRKV